MIYLARIISNSNYFSHFSISKKVHDLKCLTHSPTIRCLYTYTVFWRLTQNLIAASKAGPYSCQSKRYLNVDEVYK